MNESRHARYKSGVSMRWMTRLLSIVISAVFLFILFLAVTNEDRLQGPAIFVLALLGITIVACFTAWRWERTGGVIVIIGALCLSLAAYFASQTFGLRSLSFLPALIYGVPFLTVGILFWACGQSAAVSSSK